MKNKFLTVLQNWHIDEVVLTFDYDTEDCQENKETTEIQIINEMTKIDELEYLGEFQDEESLAETISETVSERIGFNVNVKSTSILDFKRNDQNSHSVFFITGYTSDLTPQFGFIDENSHNFLSFKEYISSKNVNIEHLGELDEELLDSNNITLLGEMLEIYQSIAVSLKLPTTKDISYTSLEASFNNFFEKNKDNFYTPNESEDRPTIKISEDVSFCLDLHVLDDISIENIDDILRFGFLTKGDKRFYLSDQEATIFDSESIDDSLFLQSEFSDVLNQFIEAYKPKIELSKFLKQGAKIKP